ncbi:MAG TPA: DNA translocase FtsK [Solirubrobacterales bacterium]|jgi:S-DNA-T family DNA segregation ATPase FtsK/SpoIIIE|nr:DNA translocase FtsK [Solirubrobacterales bacterium]
MLADKLFGAPERKPPARRKRSAPARGRAGAGRGAGARRGGGPRRAPSPEVRQRRMDLLGLCCVALAVYLGYVIYLGWNGGAVGNGAEAALAYAVGKGAVVFPVVLALGGLALIMKPLMPSPGAIAVGAFAVCAGLLLALAAQTAGLAPGGTREELFQPDFFRDHGGGLGEVLYWASTTLFQRLGAHIIAVLLVIAGALLIAGRSVSDMIAAAHRGFSRARDGAADFVTLMRDSRVQTTDPDLIHTDPSDTDPIFGPPEPLHEAPTIKRADTDEDLPTAANFDEAVRIGDEPTTSSFRAIETTGDSPDIAGGDASEASEPGADGAGALDDARAAGEIKGPALTPMGEKRGITESEEIDYVTPDPERMLERGLADRGPEKSDHEAVARTLLETLGHFGVEAQLVGVVSGPHVSRYELRLAPGTKVSKITQLRDDLAYALASTDIRILAPIPGKQAVGVEVPNQRRRLVRLGDIYGGRPAGSSPLVAWLGKDISGSAVWTDLQKMPHALIAGTTGSGKSGSVNAILGSLLLHASPNELRLVLVDPKQVELNHYERVPHLLTPVVTSPRLAANVLNNLIAEMESRYTVMSAARARNIGELNKVRERDGEPPLPYILCVIDELADLMMVAPTEVEDAIIRLAQKARAVGIHLLLATQRPSTDIITGTIKVNIPSRMAFAVSSQVDSRVILDQGGAETLLGQGDMLFRPAGTSKLQRIQGAFITEDEIAAITDHWADQGEPEFAEELLEAPEASGDASAGEEDFDPDQDDLLEQAAHVVVESGTASVSMIQRRLRVGYTRAGRLIDMLERRGIISGYEGSKPRQVLVSMADLPRVLGGGEPRVDEDTGPMEAVGAPDD